MCDSIDVVSKYKTIHDEFYKEYLSSVIMVSMYGKVDYPEEKIKSMVIDCLKTMHEKILDKLSNIKF